MASAPVHSRVGVCDPRPLTQARNSEELPECVMGCVRLDKCECLLSIDEARLFRGVGGSGEHSGEPESPSRSSGSFTGDKGDVDGRTGAEGQSKT